MFRFSDLIEPTPEVVDTQDSIDKVQNEIIKLNVNIMKQLQAQVEELNNKVDSLGNNVANLNTDVEEVKEPTDIEKLESRKINSHPYYMNLNDMWKGGNFQKRQDEYDEQGMRKLEDGTYIADFDTISAQIKNDNDFE